MNGQVSTLNGAKGRRKWSAKEKLRILEEARQAGESVSEVCRRHQVAPG
ncbi:MAG TPA: transposase [Thermosynergistes sp.]|nr:transposase [Synergistota bacterium]HPZ77353.1 transposase [Thermosynergistes sp.]